MFVEATRITEAHCEDSLKDRFLSALESSGVAAVVVQNLVGNTVGETIFSTFPQYACTGYRERECHKADPFLASSLQEADPVIYSWTEDDANLPPDMDNFFADLNAHGLQDVVSFPMRTYSGAFVHYALAFKDKAPDTLGAVERLRLICKSFIIRHSSLQAAAA